MLFILGDPATPKFYLGEFTLAYSSALNVSHMAETVAAL
jgi:hypothetical protein